MPKRVEIDDARCSLKSYVVFVSPWKRDSLVSTTMLLKPKVRQMLERAVLAGVPPVAAGMTLGIRAKTITGWMTTGFSFLEKNPERPEFPNRMVEIDNEGSMASESVLYDHDVQCALLARAVAKTEGKLVSGLVRRMWKNSGANPDMMKFLFRQYGHAHGIQEPSKESSKDSKMEGLEEEDPVTISIPDNGRGPVSK